MADTWSKLQAHKRKQECLRERLAKRRKERQVLMENGESNDEDTQQEDKAADQPSSTKTRVEDLEKLLAVILSKKEILLPCTNVDVQQFIKKEKKTSTELVTITTVLEKLEAQNLVSIKRTNDSMAIIECEYIKLQTLHGGAKTTSELTNVKKKRKKKEETMTRSPQSDATKKIKESKKEPPIKKDAIADLLSMPTMKESENKKLGHEILDLLNQKTAMEQSLVEKFKSQGGAMVREFCQYGTKDECRRNNSERKRCKKLHFRKIIQPHTDEFLGDCSFLNTCFHMDTCKYVHYEVDQQTSEVTKTKETVDSKLNKQELSGEKIILTPAQWIQCDVRFLDFDVIGKFSVIMADPPWDIHMELPYGTMADHEMKQLQVQKLQDDGYIFLWVTGRAIELGRDCLDCWGYKRVDELIWVKTNQLQRLIRTGRTGHWINHGKEHCIIGVKGNPDPTVFNKGLDCDVLVSEVRDTSHKPDEIYGLIERLAPGQRKLEIFGRQHNVQPNWITLGNQLSGVNLVEPSVVMRFKDKYPSGSCLEKPIPTIIDVTPQQGGS